MDIRLVMAELGIVRLDLTHLCAKDFCFGIAGHLAACVQIAPPWLPVLVLVQPLFVFSVQPLAHFAEARDWIPRRWFLREPLLTFLQFFNGLWVGVLVACSRFARCSFRDAGSLTL